MPSSPTNDAQKIEWPIYPHSSLEIRTVYGDSRGDRILVTGNPRGFASIANIMLWLQGLAEGHEVLSITALPFVKPVSAISFAIRLIYEDESEDSPLGPIVRMDKAEQFEWHVTDSQLQCAAVNIHGIACQPGHEYMDCCFSSGSNLGLEFRLVEFKQ